MAKEIKENLLWQCTISACVKVTSEGTGNKKRIFVSNGTDKLSFTPKEFNALKEAIKKGDL